MSAETIEYKVFLFRNDYNAICAEVYRRPDIETGGNLFGLWTTSGNAVVHVALGPGKNCSRTSVSFHQDKEYMQRVGRFLNDKFMLCHIGEWHSHHQLSLNEPSTGDKRTIKKHYPQGMKTFLVIIANIVDIDRVVLSPYFFTENGNTCKKGGFEVLEVDSPFTADFTITEETKLGSENQPIDLVRRTNTNNREINREDQPRGRVPSPKLPQTNDHPSSYVNTRDAKTGSGDVLQVRIPPPDYGTSSSSSQAARNSSSDQARIASRSQSSGYPLACGNCNLRNSSSANQMDIDENEKPTRQEVILKKLKDVIELMNFSDSEIDIQRSFSGEIEMKFKHQSNYWLIQFPKSFPENPAKTYFSYNKDSRPFQHSIFNPESLNNHINILLKLKEECGRSSCTSCKKITVESLTQSDPTFSLFLSEGFAIVNDLWNQIERTLADHGSFEKKISNDSYPPYNPTLKISFTHSSNCWIVELTSSFPASPAKLKWKRESGFGYSRVYFHPPAHHPYASTELDSASKILSAISKECACHKCKNLGHS